MTAPMDVQVTLPHLPKTDFEFRGKSLGHGGFGTVMPAFYKARQEWCAIKCLFPGASQQTSQQFLASEAERMASARHDNILTLYGLMITTDQVEIVGLVMPLMEYGSIDNVWKRVNSPVPLPLDLRWLSETADAINYLHTLPTTILHMDLKPSNILLNPDLHAKITDFGLSKMRGLVKVDHDGVGGTPGFMAPEHLRDVTLEPTTKSDIYSYGITIFSIFGQRTPYRGENMNHVKERVKNDGCRPDLKQLPRVVCQASWWPDMQNLMMRCWSEGPADRPEFKDFVGDLRHLVKSQGGQVKKAVDRMLQLLDQPNSSMSQLAAAMDQVDIEESVIKQRSLLLNGSVDLNEDRGALGNTSYSFVDLPVSTTDEMFPSTSTDLSEDDTLRRVGMPQMDGGANQVIYNITGSKTVNIGTHFHLGERDRAPLPPMLKPGALVSNNLMWRLSQHIQRQKGDGYRFFKKLGLSKDCIKKLYQREEDKGTRLEQIIYTLFQEWRSQTGALATRQAICQVAADMKRYDLFPHFSQPDQ